MHSNQVVSCIWFSLCVVKWSREIKSPQFVHCLIVTLNDMYLNNMKRNPARFMLFQEPRGR